MKILRYIGIGKETEFKTAVPAVFHVDPLSVGLDSPPDPMILYGGGLGRLARRYAAGPYVPQGPLEFGVDASTLWYFLALALGSDTPTDDRTERNEEKSTIAAQTTLTFTLANKPCAFGTLTVTDQVPTLLAHDDGWGKIVADGASGVTGTINYVTGVVTLAGLTGGTTYDIDYQSGQISHLISVPEALALPSFTARVGKDLYEHIFPGCVINKLGLKVERDFALASLDVAAGGDVKDDLEDEADLLLVPEYPMAFHKVKLELADKGAALSDVSAYVKSLAFELVNNADSEGAVGINSRFMEGGVDARELGLSGTLTLKFTDLDHKEAFWGGDGTGGPQETPTEKTGRITLSGGGALGYGQSVIDLPRFLFTAVPHAPKGRDAIEQAIKFVCLKDEATLKAIEATCTTLALFDTEFAP